MERDIFNFGRPPRPAAEGPTPAETAQAQARLQAAMNRPTSRPKPVPKRKAPAQAAKPPNWKYYGFRQSAGAGHAESVPARRGGDSGGSGGCAGPGAAIGWAGSDRRPSCSRTYGPGRSSRSGWRRAGEGLIACRTGRPGRVRPAGAPCDVGDSPRGPGAEPAADGNAGAARQGRAADRARRAVQAGDRALLPGARQVSAGAGRPGRHGRSPVPPAPLQGADGDHRRVANHPHGHGRAVRGLPPARSGRTRGHRSSRPVRRQCRRTGRNDDRREAGDGRPRRCRAAGVSGSRARHGATGVRQRGAAAGRTAIGGAGPRHTAGLHAGFRVQRRPGRRPAAGRDRGRWPFGQSADRMPSDPGLADSGDPRRNRPFGTVSQPGAFGRPLGGPPGQNPAFQRPGGQPARGPGGRSGQAPGNPAAAGCGLRSGTDDQPPADDAEGRRPPGPAGRPGRTSGGILRAGDRRRGEHERGAWREGVRRQVQIQRVGVRVRLPQGFRGRANERADSATGEAASRGRAEAASVCREAARARPRQPALAIAGSNGVDSSGRRPATLCEGVEPPRPGAPRRRTAPQRRPGRIRPVPWPAGGSSLAFLTRADPAGSPRPHRAQALPQSPRTPPRSSARHRSGTACPAP